MPVRLYLNPAGSFMGPHTARFMIGWLGLSWVPIPYGEAVRRSKTLDDGARGINTGNRLYFVVDPAPIPSKGTERGYVP